MKMINNKGKGIDGEGGKDCICNNFSKNLTVILAKKEL